MTVADGATDLPAGADVPAARSGSSPQCAPATSGLFARCVQDHACQYFGYPLTLLRAGCMSPADDLGLDELHDDGFEISVFAIDQDHPLTRAAATAAATAGAGPDPEAPLATPALGTPLLGDLRTVPLPPRSFDIVHCALLLERIAHAELVLDRFVAALKPGGLLLLRIRDSGSAAAFLDRVMPGVARRFIWRRLRPGEPGPFPAVYEPLASAPGIQSYALRRGLVIAQREALRTLPRGPDRLSRGLAAAQALVSRLTRGRLTDSRDELLYVIRKPENRFARVV